jgi:kinetochore protein Mis12/MTW1
MASNSAVASTSGSKETNAKLVTEILGYHPQLLLDELMSSVNETIYESISSVEEFLNKWIDGKEEKGENVEHLRKELDQVSPASSSFLNAFLAL